eukprot:2136-Heterococcus_DN1.PRE.5
MDHYHRHGDDMMMMRDDRGMGMGMGRGGYRDRSICCAQYDVFRILWLRHGARRCNTNAAAAAAAAAATGLQYTTTLHRRW